MNTATPAAARVYPGVSWSKRDGRWVAKISYKCKDFNIYQGPDQEFAVRALDFSKLLVFGLYPSRWHYNAKRPTYSVVTDEVRVYTMRKLLHLKILTPEELQKRVAEYDEVVERYSKTRLTDTHSTG